MYEFIFNFLSCCSPLQFNLCLRYKFIFVMRISEDITEVVIEKGFDIMLLKNVGDVSIIMKHLRREYLPLTMHTSYSMV